MAADAGKLRSSSAARLNGRERRVSNKRAAGTAEAVQHLPRGGVAAAELEPPLSRPHGHRVASALSTSQWHSPNNALVQTVGEKCSEAIVIRGAMASTRTRKSSATAGAGWRWLRSCRGTRSLLSLLGGGRAGRSREPRVARLALRGRLRLVANVRLELLDRDSRGESGENGARLGPDVLVEDCQGDGESGDRIWHVDDARDATLTGAARQEQVDLLLGIAKVGQVLDAVQHRPLVGQRRVEEVLFALLIDGDAFKDQELGIARLQRPNLEDWVDAEWRWPDRRQHLHASFDDRDLELKEARHLDCTAEGDLAVALREVHVAHRQVGARHEDGQIERAAARQVLDVAIPAVLTAGHRARRLGRDAVPHRVGAHLAGAVAELAEHRAALVWQAGERPCVAVAAGCLLCRRAFFVHQCLLALVPHGQQLGRRGGPNQPRVDEPSEAHARDVARAAVDALKVPDGLGRLRIVVSQEPPTIVFVESAAEAPFVALQRSQVQDFNLEKIAWLGRLDCNRATQVVHLREVDVFDVVC
mmetsp:Transcript_20753/g.67150  ORF Transcript_20753/g.67150 Transcript_20753/m.67150 type:complete len:531 (-) Transcript_20753:214-1806(-)